MKPTKSKEISQATEEVVDVIILTKGGGSSGSPSRPLLPGLSVTMGWLDMVVRGFTASCLGLAGLVFVVKLITIVTMSHP